MAIYVMRRGVAPNTTPITTIGSSTNNINFDCPTNPIIYDTASYTTDYRTFAYVSTDDTHTQNFVQQLQGSDTAGTEYSNLITTEGHKIKCWDEEYQTGIQFKASGSGSFVTIDSTYDYFVLIYSDSTLEHHVAKITQFTQDDEEGDSFEFESRLGNQIPKDTKFMVFRGPLKTENTIVAVTSGVQAGSVANSSYEINKGFNIAKPSFYFYNDRLDKKNELDHNTKYYLSYEVDNLSSATISLGQNTTFVTMQDFNLRITDYSKYTMKANLVDNIRELDDPRNALSSNEGFTVGATPDFTDYDNCFYNARSHIITNTDIVNSATLTNNYESLGHNRYVHYDYSPFKNNFNPFMVDLKIFESFGRRHGYCESKIVDTPKIMASKTKEFDLIRTRHLVHRAEFNDFFTLKADVNSNVSGNQYLFDTDYDLTNLISQYDEVMVGERILIVNAIGAFSSNQQTITFESENRLETESSFTTNSYTLTANQSLKRRAWSPSKNTLLTTYPILEDRYYNMKVLFNASPLGELEANVTSTNEEQQTLTLSFDTDIYDSTLSNLDYYVGQYAIEIERFEGEIDQIDITTENGQQFLRIYGRDSFSKMISPVINENTLFSKDIIYSSDSPLNKLILAGTISSALTHSSVGLTLNTVSSAPSVGDKLYVRHNTNGNNFSLIGTVRTYDSSLKAITLEEKYPLSISTGLQIYKDSLSSSRAYMLNKALSSNNKLDVFPTSLSSSADKGLVFESGVKVSDGSSLVGTSEDADFRALGYHIHGPQKIGKSESFQSYLGKTGQERQTFETVNTLMDFTVLNISKTDGKTTIELAPYVPLTLGRLDYNDADQYDIANYDSIGTSTNPPSSLTDDRRYIELSSKTANIPEGRAVYVDNLFVGYCTQMIKPSTSTNWRVYVDRAIVYETSKVVSYLAYDNISTYSRHSPKKTSNLYFVNGEHLHGGKFVALVNSLFYFQDAYGSSVDGRPTLYEVPSFQNYDSSIEKFGNPLYKLNHIEQGSYNIYTPTVTNYATTVGANYYHKIPSKLKYYCSAYKVGGNISTNSGIVHDRYEEISHSHLPIEARGRETPLGSLYFDYNIYESGHSKDTILVNSNPNFASDSRYLARDMMRNYDAKAERLFLFANADKLPYSSRRDDSLMSLVSSTDDLKNYSLLLLNQPSLDDYSDSQSSHLGGGKAKKYLDSDYDSAPISEADRDVSQLVRTGIMRLTEVTFDCFMNQINPEKIPSKKETIKSFTYKYYDISSLTESVSSYGSSQITLSGSVAVSDLDILVDDNGNEIGKANGNQNSSTIILYNDPIPTNNGSEYTGTLYVANKKEVDIKGHGETDSIVSFEEDIHPLKSGFFRQAYTNSVWTSTHGNFEDPASSGTTNLAVYVSNLMFPFSISASSVSLTFGTNSLEGSISGHSSLFLKELNTFVDYDSSLSSEKRYKFRDVLHFTALDEYSVEGTNFKISKGTNSSALAGIFLKRYLTSDIITVAMETQSSFGVFDGPASATAITTNDLSSGILYVNKLRLKINIGAADYKDISASTTSGSTLVTVLNTAGLFSGMTVTGTGIPVGATVSSIVDDQSFNLSVNATATNSGLTITASDSKTVTETTIKTVNDATLYKYSITDDYLDYFTDLTGTYLVSESGREFRTATQIDNSYGTNTYNNSVTTGINNMIPDILAYVVSHEIDTSNATRTHIIVTDKQLTNQFYRVMQPNETAFYEFTPKNIKLNTLSSEYTKKVFEDGTYDSTNDYHQKGSGTRSYSGLSRSTEVYNKNQGHNEAVLSMYVLVDLDMQVNSGSRAEVVPRTHADASYVLRNTEWDKEYTICLSDGNTSFKSSMQLNYMGDSTDNKGTVLTFDEMKELHGVVSLSEPFTITTFKSIQGTPKRALIGSVVSIGKEADYLVNSLMEKNNLEFTQDAEEYPVFITPNFKSTDLYSAVNYILEQKDKSLIYEDSKFKILDKDSNRLNPKVTITDSNNDFQIRDISKSDVLFDFYNEIIVYGQSHIAKKRNITSITKRGRKTLEVQDFNIVTQNEADKKALELLQLHSSFNQKIAIEIGHDNLPQIQAGDIIELEFKRENIERNRYLILQIEHSVDGFMRMELGRFSKGLEDRLAEILIDAKQTKASIRQAELDTIEESTFLTTLNIRERKLLIKSRTTTGAGSFTIGFVGTIGFTSPMGFGTGGTTTETIQVEEEL